MKQTTVDIYRCVHKPLLFRMYVTFDATQEPDMLSVISGPSNLPDVDSVGICYNKCNYTLKD